MKKISLMIMLLAALSFLESCNKTVDPVWMKLDETFCKPPWVANTDYRSRKNLEATLRADGIIPLKIRIKGVRNNNCENCWCLTGKTYEVQVDRSQMSWLFYYGFETKN
ncbi:MAG: hypothetical protein WDZ35_07440 [Crocinitomicaceae bacterium]